MKTWLVSFSYGCFYDSKSVFITYNSLFVRIPKGISCRKSDFLVVANVVTTFTIADCLTIIIIERICMVSVCHLY